jgi:ribonuclease D
MTEHPVVERAEHVWIDQVAGLRALAEAMATAPWIALDTEANSMFVYRECMCLLQVNAGGRLFVVDTLALLSHENRIEHGPSGVLDALRPQLERGDRPCYVHGGEYDVGIFKRDFGIALGGIWDSQQAASFLGWEKTGYGSVVERVCALALDKAYTQYDWGTRPLDPNALRYAIDDVVWLPRVCEHLKEAIRAADLDDELEIANRAVSAATWSGGFDPGGFWRIKGVRELKPHALSILAALHAWRDALARTHNKPPGRIINNENLLALARNQPTNFQLLKRVGVRGWILSAHGEDLIATIKAAQSDSGPLPPRPRHREVLPIEEERETRLKDWRRAESERRKVPLQVVLPAKALEHLKQHGADDLASVPQLGAKRVALYGADLQRLCS